MSNLDKIIRDHVRGVEVNDVNEYINLPATERTESVWFWPAPWYKRPSSLPCNIDEGILSQWERLDKFLKAQFPVQFFLREDVDMFFRLKHNQFYAVWYPFKCFFKPCNKNIRKLVPNTFKCGDDIIEDILTEVFLSTVTPREIECWKQDQYSEFWRNKAVEAENCRTWFTVDKKVMQNKLDEARKNILKTGNYEEKYGALNKIEEELKNNDTRWFKWIVENREILD